MRPRETALVDLTAMALRGKGVIGDMRNISPASLSTVGRPVTQSIFG